MLTHEQIWMAIDRLAAHAGLSPSGLARRAGLDPTTFNKSKRMTADGRTRWPSTESVSRALAAADTTLDTFVQFITAPAQATRTIPLLGFAEAGSGHVFDDGGLPTGNGWSTTELLSPEDTKHIYALEISGQSMEPAYRDGDIIIVSPTVPIRRGDRVVVKTTAGEVMAKQLQRRSTKTIQLLSLHPHHDDRTLAASDVAWIARIIWVSQ
jgi:phage repressor protein C with HTH and peptisase S24 domain